MQLRWSHPECTVCFNLKNYIAELELFNHSCCLRLKAEQVPCWEQLSNLLDVSV